MTPRDSSMGVFLSFEREAWRRGSFPCEIVEHGEPEIRPERGSIVVQRTSRMVALEKRYCGRALYATLRWWSVVQGKIRG